MDLRERRRRSTMRHVQQVALDLFEERGFDAVSVAQVAAAAQIAERTVYRHFGTKEMLVVHDEADDAFLADLLRHAAVVGAVDAVEAALAGPAAHGWRRGGPTAQAWLRKMRLLRATPALRTVFEQAVSELGDALGAAEQGGCGADAFAARVRGRAVAAMLAAAAEAWVASDGDDDLAAFVRAGVEALRTPARPGAGTQSRGSAIP
ncbi:TetR family transcriptional regulator [Isoptericola haloaureus]|uniref:TetR family transcriptional regulator n=1 Tax=Isoptericola haloaureus TaxID=1542902 RepID=A0ABU7ZAR7_9MICO